MKRQEIFGKLKKKGIKFDPKLKNKDLLKLLDDESLKPDLEVAVDKNVKEKLNMKLMFIGPRNNIVLRKPMFSKRYFFNKWDAIEMDNEDDFISALRLGGTCIFKRVTYQDILNKKKEIEIKRDRGRGLLTEQELKEEYTRKNPIIPQVKVKPEPEKTGMNAMSANGGKYV